MKSEADKKNTARPIEYRVSGIFRNPTKAFAGFISFYFRLPTFRRDTMNLFEYFLGVLDF